MEVVLSLDPKEKNEGYQYKLKEDERLKLYDLFNQKPVRRPFNGARGTYRGNRGGYRTERGNRGGRGLKGIEVVLEEVVIEGIEEAITIKPNRFQKVDIE